jgi:hypothetical protein
MYVRPSFVCEHELCICTEIVKILYTMIMKNRQSDVRVRQDKAAIYSSLRSRFIVSANARHVDVPEHEKQRSLENGEPSEWTSCFYVVYVHSSDYESRLPGDIGLGKIRICTKSYI